MPSLNSSPRIGAFVDTPQGRTCVMGHVLEDLWFQIAIDEDLGRTDRLDTCCRLVRRHLAAWDDPFGGLSRHRH